MARQARGRGTSAAATVALVRANARFWPTVFPDVRRELRRWDRTRTRPSRTRALRAQALAKLRDERFNTRGRRDAGDARRAGAPPRRGRGDRRAGGDVRLPRRAHRAADPRSRSPTGAGCTAPSPTPRAPAGPFADYGREHPRRDDGGYLAALAATCRRALWSLPAAPVVAPVASAVLTRCGEAQTRTHAVAALGAGTAARRGRRRSRRPPRCAGRRSPPAPPPPCSPATR